MPGFARLFPLKFVPLFGVLLAGLFGCSASQPPGTAKKSAASTNRPTVPVITADPAKLPPAAGAPAPAAPTPATPAPMAPAAAGVMLGIDVLEANGFNAVAGKSVGLLTHPAGVNRHGETTVSVLRRAPKTKLVALFGPEHGIYGNEKAEIPVADRIDARTGLPVYSLYGKFRKPTPAMLKGLDALVIDLQDIGSRSYTYVSCMRYAMEACFENNVEVIVLDRPNPLGGLKVSGPPLDTQWTSYVGAFRVPYVHGLTIAELARMAASAPGVLAISDKARGKGRLTLVPMRGWRRSMRWPETGLTFVPTSPYVQDFAACVGYAMTGLGTYMDPNAGFDIGFRHGVGPQYAFRGLSHSRLKSDVIERELKALKLPGLAFRRVSVPGLNGKPATGVYIEINDWDEWQPTELSFHLMRLACRLEPARNPFVSARDASGFLRHMGSTDFFNALKRDGAKVNLEWYLQDWRLRAGVYQDQSRKYWLYH